MEGGIDMKKILILAVITAFFIMPSMSFAQSVIVSDVDLGSIFATEGSITVTFSDITIGSLHTKSVSTDGWNYWDPKHDYPSPHIHNAPGFFDGTPENNPQQNPGFDGANIIGYFGYDIDLTGGLVERSGSITLEVTDIAPTDPFYSDVKSGCKLNVRINSLSINAHIGLDTTMRVGVSSDFSGPGMVLLHHYIEAIAGTASGSLSIYARTNSF
jgi:hypothetical protein